MSKATYFISDLHLSNQTPALIQKLAGLLQTWETDAEALYILGDLFEYWAGDEQLAEPASQHVAQLLKNASQHYPVYVLHGNRDFLLGQAFAQTASITLLPENTRLELYGQPVLIAHGDALCTDDVAYQQFRGMVRNPAWQAQFLALPLGERLKKIAEVKMTSDVEKQGKSASIMDTNDDAIDALLRAENFPVLVHGHTHRPAVHEFELDGHACERWVLPDWYDEEGGYLKVAADGWEMEKF